MNYQKMAAKLKIETLLLHGGYAPGLTAGSSAVPIYQTAAYRFKNTRHAANLFSLKEFGDIYSRLTNPTVRVLEERMAFLEDGRGALAVSSGQSAVTLAVLNIAKQGDEIVSFDNLYGGVYNLFRNIFPRLGITAKF